jgi:porin
MGKALRLILILATIAWATPCSRADSTTQSQPQPSPFASNLTGDWFGYRQKLADSGVQVGASLIAEGFNNFTGGIQSNRPVGATTFDFNLTFDLQKLLHINEAQLYFDLEDHAFRNPTTALTGDLQVFDNLNSSPYLQVFALWYQQNFFTDKLRIKIGKVDANTEFCVIDNGAPFIHSSAQDSPTIFPMPTTPDPAPSVNLFFTPTPWYFASVGAYYANQSSRFGYLVDDPSTAQRTLNGAFLIGETGFRWNSDPLFKLPGNLKLGAWGDTGTFTTFQGSQQQGTEGAYAVFNQTLYQPTGEPTTGRGLRMFLIYGDTQPDLSPITQQFGAGFSYTGLIQSRPQDILGFTAQYAQLSSGANLPYPYELALETLYQIQLTPAMQLQPDLQYIIHPGGLYHDALVATLRWTIQF